MRRSDYQMIYVCDTIMGSGKTSAAIDLINSRPGQKFIYASPYLAEAERIKEACPSARFAEPSGNIEEYHFRKKDHTEALLGSGCNVATTQQTLRRYSAGMAESIYRQKYTLILDECIDVLERVESGFNAYDIGLLEAGGYVKRDGDRLKSTGVPFGGEGYTEIFDILRTRELVYMDIGEGGGASFCWMLPVWLFSSFKDVYVLTYLFEGQNLAYFMDAYGLEYEYIGVKCEDRCYRFTEPGERWEAPEYTRSLSGMIHICDNVRLNAVGENRCSLSKTWFEKEENAEGIHALRCGMANYFRNVNAWSGADDRLWGTYCDARGKLKGKGYTKCFLPFNARATNEYRDRTCLIYAANVFMNVNDKKYYYSIGANVNENMYALSVMIQWVWRSAIREGKEIWIYIPSRRMRVLFEQWMESLKQRRP